MTHRLLAALAVITLAVAACGDDGSLSEQDAQALGDDFVAALNSGDADRVLSQFTEDALVFFAFGGGFEDGEPLSEWELLLRWDLAQGSTFTNPICRAGEPTDDGRETVSCSYGTRDAPVTAVDATDIPTATTLVLADGRIQELRQRYTFPDLGTVGEPFSDWMEANHPEDAEAAGCCAGDTAEEAVANGELRLKYALEWAAFLDEAGCTWNMGC